MNDLELFRNNERIAQGTIDLLRKELNDNVGELSLARERVTTLETLLENAVQRAVKEKEQTEDIADTLTEIKANCTSGFGELRAILKSLLDANVAQMTDVGKLLLKMEEKEMTKEVGVVEKELKDMQLEMRKAEKRIRRVALGGGFRVVDKLVTVTEALEKLFKQECEGIMKT